MALAMVLSGCLRMRHAYRAVNWESIVLIAGMLPLATAMEKSGGMRVLVGCENPTARADSGKAKSPPCCGRAWPRVWPRLRAALFPASRSSSLTTRALTARQRMTSASRSAGTPVSTRVDGKGGNSGAAGEGGDGFFGRRRPVHLAAALLYRLLEALDPASRRNRFSTASKTSS